MGDYIIDDKLNDEEKKLLPITWRMMHTEEDNIENLTVTSWGIMQKFLDTLISEN